MKADLCELFKAPGVVYVEIWPILSWEEGPTPGSVKVVNCLDATFNGLVFPPQVVELEPKSGEVMAEHDRGWKIKLYFCGPKGESIKTSAIGDYDDC